MSLDDFPQISEELLRTQADLLESENLWRLLKIADEWRACGCTPVFIYFGPSTLGCVSVETFGKHLV
jgi:hypothetical protein